MDKQLLIATTNRGKIIEISDLLKSLPLQLITPDNLPVQIEVEETGATYLENALLKAKAFCQVSRLPALADDTGLEVEALGGIPGLHSARFINKPGATDRDRRELLLSRLADHPRPWKARFVCAAVLALPNGEIYTNQETCEGEIIPQERGEQGFGYDAIFLFPQLNQTMAELSLEQKNRISHRALAIQGIIPCLNKI